VVCIAQCKHAVQPAGGGVPAASSRAGQHGAVPGLAGHVNSKKT
jgi:hypothetical protein